MNYLATIIPGYSGWSDYSMIAILFLLIFSIGIFYLIIHYFLYKTEWLIDRFKLDQGFDDERIDIAISTQTFIAIIISVLGGIYFIDSVPSLCKALYNFYQQSFVFRQSPKSNSIVFYLVESIFGYILLMNGSFLSNKLLGFSF